MVSRGELIEIGDGFRLPELLASTGARLREVGTTNRTHLRDYAARDRAGHRVRAQGAPVELSASPGSPRRSPIAELADSSDVPLVVDIGSGLLTPHPLLPDEPDAATRAARRRRRWSRRAATSCSAGRRPGLLLGDAELVERLRRHPAARALRVDKLTLAALEATLRRTAAARWPRRCSVDVADAARRGPQRLAAQLRRRAGGATASPRSAGAARPASSCRAPPSALPASCAARAAHRRRRRSSGASERGRCLLDLRTVAARRRRPVLRATR